MKCSFVFLLAITVAIANPAVYHEVQVQKTVHHQGVEQEQEEVGGGSQVVVSHQEVQQGAVHHQGVEQVHEEVGGGSQVVVSHQEVQQGGEGAAQEEVSEHQVVSHQTQETSQEEPVSEGGQVTTYHHEQVSESQGQSGGDGEGEPMNQDSQSWNSPTLGKYFEYWRNITLEGLKSKGNQGSGPQQPPPEEPEQPQYTTPQPATTTSCMYCTTPYNPPTNAPHTYPTTIDYYTTNPPTSAPHTYPTTEAPTSVPPTDATTAAPEATTQAISTTTEWVCPVVSADEALRIEQCNNVKKLLGIP